MKKIVASLFSVGVCLLFSVAVNAQRDVSIESKNGDVAATSVFDANNFLNSEGLSGMGVPIDAAKIGAKVQKTFAQKFGDRSGVSWSQLSKHNYLAQFDLDGRKTNALFANNGFMVYAVTYGRAEHAPRDVRNILRSIYPDFDMGATFQVRYKGQSYDNAWADQTAWVVNLEDEKSIVIARVVDGSVDELANLQKMAEQRKVRKGKVIIPKQ